MNLLDDSQLDYRGWGADTVGGTGGTVLRVTNLSGNKNTVGSLHYNLKAPFPRIIVFDVSGTIEHTEPVKITSPHFTIAGETSPRGITLAGEEVRVQTHDWIIRHLRIRTGDVEEPDDGWDARDCVGVVSLTSGAVYNGVIANCSLSWSVDEVLSVYGDGTHDITIQDCILAEGLHYSNHPGGGHSMGFLVGNTCENISFHHNLIISCDGRQPQLVGPGAVDFRSNWIHNWGTYACRLKEDGVSVTPFPVNLVGNIWSEGPDAARHNFYQGREIGFDAPSALQLYIDKNTSRSCPTGTEEQWNMTFDITDGSTPDEGTYRVATAHDAPSVIPRELTNYPDHDTNPRYLRRWIATHAGARLPLLDRIDQRLIREALGGNGKIPDSVSDVIDAAPWAATRVLPLPWIN